MAREFDFVCLTLAIYDYVLTVDCEAQNIWKSRWSIGLGMFYLNRYLVFVDQILLFHFGNMPNPSAKICERIFKAGLWVMMIGENVAGIILYLQLRAIWGGRRYIVYPIGVLLLARAVTGVMVAHIEFDFASYFVAPSQRGPLCVVLPAARLIKYRYIVSTLAEGITIFFTIFRAWYHIRKSHSRWVVQLYRNGILYGLVVLIFSAVNLAIAIRSKDPRTIGILSKQVLVPLKD
ncbi:hypothetical protein BKA70DRAFT_1444955 [Coprinopsis sp. MPI-PUGE-AT-0042]|nr:hypothetical protein BKA70DRAFT_1444955 [Coprinopsis sp. MPI-PUGE-AT-0042]